MRSTGRRVAFATDGQFASLNPMQGTPAAWPRRVKFLSIVWKMAADERDTVVVVVEDPPEVDVLLVVVDEVPELDAKNAMPEAARTTASMTTTAAAIAFPIALLRRRCNTPTLDTGDITIRVGRYSYGVITLPLRTRSRPVISERKLSFSSLVLSCKDLTS